MSVPAEEWDNDQVVAYLESINLAGLVPIFRSHQIHGDDLVSLTESELKAELNITRLQARRIKRHLEATSDQKQEEDAEPSVPSPDVTGDIPHAEAPDLEDRNALRPSSGSFFRSSAVVGIPVNEASPLWVDAETATRYSTTVQLIAQLEREQVSIRLPVARESLAQLEQRLAAEQSKFNDLLDSQEKKQKKADELKSGKWYPGKFLFGKSRADAKLEKATEEVEAVERKVRAAGAVLEAMHQQKESLSREVQELRSKVSQLQQAKQWEEGILPQIFAGVAGDARENALEQQVDALIPRLHQGRQYQTSYGQAFELIRSARKQLTQSQELFQSAYGLATVNLVGGVMRGRHQRRRPMGTMADIAKRAQSRQAAQLAHAACDSIMKARSIIPAIPNIDINRVRALRGLGLLGLMFDNVAVDLIARQKVQSAMRTVAALIPEVVAADHWLEGWLGRVRQDLSKTEQEYAAKKAELDACRRELMMNQVAAQEMAARAAAPTMLVATIATGTAASGVDAAGAPPVLPELL